MYKSILNKSPCNAAFDHAPTGMGITYSIIFFGPFKSIAYRFYMPFIGDAFAQGWPVLIYSEHDNTLL